jgi:phosphoglycolate/pyridoxal phosphate phosphatase family enzyme
MMSCRTPMRLYDAYVFDLDGTICLGEALLPDAAKTVDYLRAAGRRTLFLSNNSTKTRESYAKQLTAWGIATAPESVINSSVVMIKFLKTRHPEARLFVVGEDPLKQDLRDAGFRLVDDAKMVDVVVASFDRTFDYRKLQTAFDAIRAGARFFATNSDRYRPTDIGGEPDAAAIIAAIEACTSTVCEEIVGKPSRHTISAILDVLGISPEKCLIIGDRLETDVKMGLDASMSAALVLTGATTHAMALQSKIRPTYILMTLSELIPE